MKNLRKGFVVPLLLIVIVVLVIGGGAYMYKQNTESSYPSASNQSESLVQTGFAGGLTIPGKCMLADNPKSTGAQNEWFIDCGIHNNTAREYVGTALERQGWKSCGSGLGSATWWKSGVLTTVVEGDGTAPFRLTQRATSDCQ